MKKIYYMILLLLAVNVCVTACQEEEPFSTVTAYDDPRILDPTLPDRKDGKLPVVANINRDANFSMTLTVTPADYCHVSWLLDGEEVAQGKSIDINLKAGVYVMRVNVTTDAGKSTYREGLVQVNPLADDPQTTEVSFERIVAPNGKARLYGSHLETVKGLVMGGQTVSVLALGNDDKGTYLEYTVPQALENGTYRVILFDAAGNEFGGNEITVSRDPMITSGADRTNAGTEWVLSGINLDKIQSLTFGGQTLTEFVRQSATELVLTVPKLDDGEYVLKGTTSAGTEVWFYSKEGNKKEQSVIVSSMTVLWKGHHYVSWDLPDENPNKAFNLIGKEAFQSLKPGATLYIHYSVNPSDEYHQMRTTSAHWNDLPGTAAFDFSENGVKEVLLTQDILDMILSQDGFLCVGHGYYVDMVTVL